MPRSVKPLEITQWTAHTHRCARRGSAPAQRWSSGFLACWTEERGAGLARGVGLCKQSVLAAPAAQQAAVAMTTVRSSGEGRVCFEHTTSTRAKMGSAVERVCVDGTSQLGRFASLRTEVVSPPSPQRKLTTTLSRVDDATGRKRRMQCGKSSNKRRRKNEGIGRAHSRETASLPAPPLASLRPRRARLQCPPPKDPLPLHAAV